jgi:hypothetical protein
VLIGVPGLRMSFRGVFMNAVLAVLLLTAFAVIFRLAYVTFRQPHPPAWTQRNMVSELVCVGLVGLLAVGLTLTIKEVGTVWQEGLGIGETIVILASAAIAVLVWKGLAAPKARAADIVDLPRSPEPSQPRTPPGRAPRKAA